MATMNVKDAVGSTVAIEKPLAPGRAAAASSRPIALATEDKSAVDTIGTRAYGTALTRVSVAATSAPSATITGTEVLVHASTRCFIKAGSNPTATTNDIPLEAGEKFHLRITSGDKIAAIRDTADGFLNIVPVA